MFPITDRRGRVIAFGGRILGDGSAAKYINSPDTPLFDKGRTLYNLAGARQASHDSGQLLVTEGYMDVIALVRAGFKAAVAPLGTALTEEQIEQLWRLSAEPILCFDGDSAGQRAASRGAERALPLLKPGRSLRFAYLPSGQDPDSLIQGQGVAAMQRVIDGAHPLMDMIWETETAVSPLDTPERRADLEVRLRKRVAQIADDTVKQHYGDMLRERLRATFRPAARRDFPGNGRMRGNSPKLGPRSNLASLVASNPRRRQQALLATLVNHPALYEELVETIAVVDLDPDLDKLRQEIHHLLASVPGLDSDALKRHLFETADSGSLKGLLGKDVLLHAGFARTGAPLEEVQAGVRDLLASMLRTSRSRELLEEGRIAEAEGTADGEARFLRIRNEFERAESEIAKLED
jgi:DNA primase